MKHFTIDTAPPMSNGLMLTALSGPQDVAQSATTALKHLMQRDEAVTFAQANPDGLFIYNSSTPHLKRNQESGLVTIVWPMLELGHLPWWWTLDREMNRGRCSSPGGDPKSECRD